MGFPRYLLVAIDEVRVELDAHSDAVSYRRVGIVWGRRGTGDFGKESAWGKRYQGTCV